MRGAVIQFSIKANQGFISGDDGKRYKFSGSDWNLTIAPEQGSRVDFDTDIDKAVSIYEDPTASPKLTTTKSRVTAGILSLLLGGFGVQFFYLEAWGWGIVSILLFWTYIPAIAAMILGIRYLLMSDKEFERKVKKMQSSLFGPIEL